MHRTPQEDFWAGEFGDSYTDRNTGPALVAGKVALFADILRRTDFVQSVLELGANRGLNLVALQHLLPSADFYALEINKAAHAHLMKLKGVKPYLGSILEFRMPIQVDLSFTSGVLIHIDPNELSHAYDVLYHASRRYILVNEYYNPTPLEVEYRGHTGRLFKRDWAGDMMSRYADLKLISYGFVYRRDPIFPADDMTWFLLEKR